MRTDRIKKAAMFEAQTRIKSPAEETRNAPVVVNSRDFRNAFSSSVRGQTDVPQWAGKTVYASQKAHWYWSAQENEVASLASFAKLISDNQELLAEIERGNARSIAEIARSINRQQSNVSRSLTKLQKCGVVRLEDAHEGRSKTPRIISRHLLFQLDIVSGNVELASAETLKHTDVALSKDKDRGTQKENHASASESKSRSIRGSDSQSPSDSKPRRRAAEK